MQKGDMLTIRTGSGYALRGHYVGRHYVTGDDGKRSARYEVRTRAGKAYFGPKF